MCWQLPSWPSGDHAAAALCVPLEAVVALPRITALEKMGVVRNSDPLAAMIHSREASRALPAIALVAKEGVLGHDQSLATLSATLVAPLALPVVAIEIEKRVVWDDGWHTSIPLLPVSVVTGPVIVVGGVGILGYFRTSSNDGWDRKYRYGEEEDRRLDEGGCTHSSHLVIYRGPHYSNLRAMG